MRQRQRAVERYASGGRFPADEAVQRRRNARRSARIGADRAGHHAVGDRDRSPRCRAAGNATGAPIEGVFRRAVVWVDAESRVRELDHVRAADDHRAGVSQPVDDGRIACRGRRAEQHGRAAEGDDTGFVEQVLDRNRDAGQGGQRRAAASLGVHAVGGRERFVLMNKQEGARAFSVRIPDRRERLLDELAAGDFSAGKKTGQVDDGHGC